MSCIINASTSTGLVETADLSGSLQFQTNGTNTVTFTNTGSVGIGVSNPESTLEVNGWAQSTTNASAGAGFRIKTPSGSASPAILQFTNNPVTAQWATITSPSANVLTFTDGGGVERMRMANGGYLQVNNASTIASDTAPLQVTGGSVTAIAVKGGSNNYFQAFYNTSANLIGSITGSTGTTTAFNTASDYRLKENVVPMQNALGVVAKLKPVTYTWKADGSDGQGFIAHELQEVVPDCVTGEKDAVNAEGKPVYQGIDTSFLVATLTAAIQELNAKVEALEAKLGVQA